MKKPLLIAFCLSARKKEKKKRRRKRNEEEHTHTHKLALARHTRYKKAYDWNAFACTLSSHCKKYGHVSTLYVKKKKKEKRSEAHATTETSKCRNEFEYFNYAESMMMMVSVPGIAKDVRREQRRAIWSTTTCSEPKRCCYCCCCGGVMRLPHTLTQPASPTHVLCAKNHANI